MRAGLLAGMAMLVISAPALAERLTFDHRLQPALQAVLDSGNTAMIDYNASNPRYVVDRIAVRGTSASDWTELLEIIARTPARGLRSAADWARELRAGADARCPNTVQVIAQDEISLTFERKSQACAAEPARFGLYRVVAGKRSLFLLAVYDKAEPDPAARSQWLALLASAHLN